MKKILGIVVLGLLFGSSAIAKEIKIYHKDENSISMTSIFWTTGKKQNAIASKHCAQYGKFAFDFVYGDTGPLTEKGKKTRQYHCSKSNLKISPISGENILWTNYDPEHKFAKEEIQTKKKETIDSYKEMCVSLGFEIGTEKLADCTLKLMLADKENEKQNNTNQTQSKNKIDWGKVAGEFDPKYKDNNKRVCKKTKPNVFDSTNVGVSEIITCEDQ